MRATVVALLIVTLSACGKEGPAPDPSEGAEPVAQVPAVNQPEPVVLPQGPDESPPILVDAVAHNVLSWGRVEWSWTAAVDDVTARHLMSYLFVGSASGYGSVSGPADDVEVRPPQGSVEHTATVPVSHTVWRFFAVDEANNRSQPIAPQHLLLRPRLSDLLRGGVDGRLANCVSLSETLLCVGEYGRYAVWDDAGWHESHVDSPSTLRARVLSDGTALVVGDREQFRFTDGHLEPIEITFIGQPSPPMGRFTVEPSGLQFWLDRDGRLWGSAGASFRALDNPLLVSGSGCSRLNDLLFQSSIGFAWCQDGDQYAMRSADTSYRWQRMPEADSLAAPAGPQREYLFGDGREMTLLTWQGDVLRYNMGGWHPLYEQSQLGPSSAMAPSSDSRLLHVAVANQVLAVNALGETTTIADLSTSGTPIYLAEPGDDPLVVTDLGEVADFETGALLYSPPGGDLAFAVRRAGDATGAFSRDDGPTLYKWRAPMWSRRPLQVDLPDAIIAGIAELPNGTVFVTGEQGLAGGFIAHVGPQGTRAESFLYPPPAPEEAAAPDGPVDDSPEGPRTDLEPEADSPAAPPELTDTTPFGLDPTTLPTEPLALLGVPATELPVPPPVVAPLTAIDVSLDMETAVAVGMGGTVWYRISFHPPSPHTETPIDGAAVEAPAVDDEPAPDVPLLEGEEPVGESPIIGWLSVPTPIVDPLLTVHITGPGEYLVGGANGALLSCREAVCATTYLPLGDLHRFTEVGGDIVALGSDAMMVRRDGSWQPFTMRYSAPYPTGSAPNAVIAVDEGADTRWVLAADGSIWAGPPDDTLWAMGLVDNPLDLWLDDRGEPIVLTSKNLYRVEANTRESGQ